MENSNPSSIPVGLTVTERGLAQHSRTSANPKKQLGCVHLVLETLIIWTWHDSNSCLLGLGMDS